MKKSSLLRKNTLPVAFAFMIVLSAAFLTSGTTYVTDTFMNTTGTVNASGGFEGDLIGDVTGNADTATALAANGADCGVGEYPLGVDDSGAVESCTDATTEITSIDTATNTTAVEWCVAVDSATNTTVTGYVDDLLTNSANWDTAYGWGDHSTANYYSASNPYGYYNDSDFSIADYSTTSQMNTAIGTANTTNTAWTDAQDVAYNASAGAYCEAYVGAQGFLTTESDPSYPGDVWVNESGDTMSGVLNLDKSPISMTFGYDIIGDTSYSDIGLGTSTLASCAFQAYANGSIAAGGNVGGPWGFNVDSSGNTDVASLNTTGFMNSSYGSTGDFYIGGWHLYQNASGYFIIEEV